MVAGVLALAAVLSVVMAFIARIVYFEYVAVGLLCTAVATLMSLFTWHTR